MKNVTVSYGSKKSEFFLNSLRLHNISRIFKATCFTRCRLSQSVSATVSSTARWPPETWPKYVKTSSYEAILLSLHCSNVQPRCTWQICRRWKSSSPPRPDRTRFLHIWLVSIEALASWWLWRVPLFLVSASALLMSPPLTESLSGGVEAQPLVLDPSVL